MLKIQELNKRQPSIARKVVEKDKNRGREKEKVEGRETCITKEKQMEEQNRRKPEGKRNGNGREKEGKGRKEKERKERKRKERKRKKGRNVIFFQDSKQVFQLSSIPEDFSLDLLSQSLIPYKSPRKDKNSSRQRM